MAGFCGEMPSVDIQKVTFGELSSHNLETGEEEEEGCFSRLCSHRDQGGLANSRRVEKRQGEI